MFISKSSKARNSKQDGQRYGSGVVGVRPHQNVVKRVEPEVTKSRFASLENLETAQIDSRTKGCNREGNHRGIGNYTDNSGAEVWVKKKHVVGDASTSKAKSKKSQKGENYSKSKNGPQTDIVREENVGPLAGPHMRESNGKLEAQNGKGKGVKCPSVNQCGCVWQYRLGTKEYAIS